MDVTPLVAAGQQILQSYAGGIFKISGVVYESAVIVTPSRTYSWNADFEHLTADDFVLIAEQANQIDVVLLGCGPQMRFLKPELRSALKARGLSVDIMDTGAACRTYNVLLAEGRRVAAALFPA